MLSAELLAVAAVVVTVTVFVQSFTDGVERAEQYMYV